LIFDEYQRMSEKSLFLSHCTFDPPKSPLKRGTLGKFSPLKGTLRRFSALKGTLRKFSALKGTLRKFSALKGTLRKFFLPPF
jgi:hypothetical protein